MDHQQGSAVPRHPVLACVDAVEAALKDTVAVDPGFMRLADKREALLRLGVVGDELTALRLRVIAASSEVAEADAARGLASWLAHHTRTEPSTNRREAELAAALDTRWHLLAHSYATGGVNTAQVRVIAKALADLPAAELPEGVLAAAEAELIARAAEFGPRQLEVLGRRILEVVAPELCEAQEGKKLEDEERRARETTSLTSRRLGDGTTRISIKVPDSVAARLHTYLEAFTAPRRSTAEPTGARTPTPRRLGQAFCALLETLDPHRLPVHGGDATTVLITLDLTALHRELAAAGMATSTGPDGTLRISAAEARRLACTAKIIPAVLGTKSEVLDLGRSARLFSPAQRKAMIVRDQTCRAQGCTIPAAWCEAHHGGTPWTRGGNTNLADGVLLCSYHHHRAHDTRYRTDKLPNGDLRYTRRT